MKDEPAKDLSKHWREKYYQHLEQHEVAEQQLRNEVDQLRRALVSVSFVAEHMDDQLKDTLAAMRKVFRGEAQADHIDRLLNTVEVKSRSVREQDSTEHMRSSLGSLAEQLIVLPESRSLRKELKKFSKRLEDAPSSVKQLPGYLDELAQLQEQVLREILDTSTEESKPGLLGKIFGGHNTDSDDQEDVSPGQNVEPSSLENNVVHNSAADAEVATSAVDSEVIRILSRLTDKLIVPEKKRSALRSLKSLLEPDNPEFDLISVLENTSMLVQASLFHVRAEFEVYLKLINSKLLGYIQNLDDVKQGVNSSYEAGVGLSDHIRANISGLQGSVNNANDLDGLKHAVGHHLETLLEEVNEFQTDLEKNKKSQEKLTELSGRINSLEQQTEKLKSTLAVEQQRASHDSLTGLPNRQAYEDRVQLECARMCRYHSPLTLVVSDIDYFKKVNDGYGHLAGDKLLKLFAKLLHENLREVDFVGRYGGEEFVILLPNTSLETSCEVIEKIRHKIENSPFKFKDEHLHITASFGIAAFNGQEDQPEEIFERADQALYRAKSEGRNCYRIAEAGDESDK